MDAAVLDPERVDGLEPPRPVGQRIGKLERGLLVRDGDVAAPKPFSLKAAQEIGEIGGQYLDALVGAVQAVLAQPVAVDQRRTRMLDRMADDKSFWRGHARSPKRLSPLPAVRDKGLAPEAQGKRSVSGARMRGRVRKRLFRRCPFTLALRACCIGLFMPMLPSPHVRGEEIGLRLMRISSEVEIVQIPQGREQREQREAQ